MNAKIYLSLFRRRDKVMLVCLFLWFVLIDWALSHPNAHGKLDLEIGVWLWLPAIGLGAMLAGIWNVPLQRPASALLPGVQRTLFIWHTRLLLGVSFIWAVAAHAIAPQIPLAAAIGISAGLFTLPLAAVLHQKPAPFRSEVRRFIPILWGLILGLNLPYFAQFGGKQLLAHVWLAGEVGFVLAAVNLWFARKKRFPGATAGLSPVNRKQGKFFRRFGGNADWRYPTRGASLFRWVQAAFQEGPAGAWGNIAGCLLILLVIPWMGQRTEGYPLGWYRLVFDPGRFGEVAGSTFALVTALVASSLGPRLLRTHQFYPISRPQRVTVAFTASAAGFCGNFLAIVGGSVLAGWIVGRWAGLPLASQPAAEFVTKMAMVVPFMPLMRWGALRLELRQNPVELFLFIAVVAVLVIIGQSVVLEWGLPTGIVICTGSILASQFAYYRALRRFYVEGDLLQRGPTRDLTGLT